MKTSLVKALVASLVLWASVAHADSISTAGTRVIEDPVSNGDMKLRVNVGGTKTDVVSLTGSTGAVVLGPSGSPGNTLQHTARGIWSIGAIPLNIGTGGSRVADITYNLVPTSTTVFAKNSADTAAVLGLPGGFEFYSDASTSTGTRTLGDANLIKTMSSTAAGLWTIGASGGNQQHVINGTTASVASANGAIASIFRNSNSGTSAYSSARLYNDQNSGADALEFDYTSSTYTGAIISGGATGRAGAIYTTASVPLYIGVGNAAKMKIDGTSGKTELTPRSDGSGGIGTLYGGTYTPVATAGTNIAAVGACTGMYSRVGDFVTVVARCQGIDPTAATTSSAWVMTLPISSNLTGLGDLSGTATGFGNQGVAANVDAVIGNPGKAQMTFYTSADVSANIWTISLMYQVK